MVAEPVEKQKISIKTKIKRIAILVCSSLLIVALCYVGISEGYFKRIYREVECHVSGKVSVNKGIYIGELNLGILEGTGRIVFDNGDIFEGDLQKNGYNGVGVYEWSNGDKYSGQFADNKIDGKGTLSFANGDEYIGDFEDNHFSNGTLTFKNIGEYEGGFENGTRNKKGKFIWLNGDQYAGEWDNDFISGEGTCTFSDGGVLKGTFEKGRLLNGTYSVSTEKAIYTIEIENGTVKGADISFSDGTIYKGGYLNNMFHGYGEIKYTNGDVYSGDFKCGLKSGEGKYTWENGAYYSGDWDNDMINGSGTYYYAKSQKGYKLNGTFVDNKPHGKCYYYLTDDYYSKGYETDWKNGRCIKLTE